MTETGASHRLLLKRIPKGWRTACSCKAWTSQPAAKQDEVIVAHLAHAADAHLRDLLAKQLGLLTARQVQVLRLIAEGLTNREIAHELGCSHWTIHGHVHHCIVRLGASSRAHAAVLAIRAGLIPLDPAHPERAVPVSVLDLVGAGVTT